MKHGFLSKQGLLALILSLALAAPVQAEGFFDWLFGAPEPTAVAASAEVTPDPNAVTLPPADVLLEAAPTEAPTPTPAPIPDSTLEDDGLLRVSLRSMEGAQQLHLTLAGVYAVESDPGFRFERDTRLTLSAAEGRVYLAVGGLTLDMGPSLTLTRHRAEAGMANGIYIEESEKEALYCGDLCVTADGALLQAILTLPVEDYLYGVVAYEMSDSFPIEALKAQAVAARTYALRRKWQAGRKGYDVVDTTADQVFKGYDPEYVNVIQAVDDTRGVVCLYDGGFANCYYTASNGGQTALASQIWGIYDSDGYLTMRDDPYDLENPRSLQNEATFAADCQNSPALREMLEAALGEKLAGEGWGEGEWKLDAIAAVEPVNPRFEGSRMFDGLKFGLTVELLTPVATEAPTATDAPAPSDAPDPSRTPEVTDTPEPTDAPEPTAQPTEIPREWRRSEAPVEVVLDVYGQIKDGLSLGLNGGDWELISVETEADASGAAQAFTLIMRRYGHGVGMSQRGAQWMAGHYGMSWRDILSFYYPGLELARMVWPESALTDLMSLPAGVGAARPQPTPTPTPVPLPEPRPDEHYAVVLPNSLNLRQRPTTSSLAIDQLAQGRRVLVSGEPDADGWVPVRTGDAEGFVKAEYLKDEE